MLPLHHSPRMVFQGPIRGGSGVKATSAADFPAGETTGPSLPEVSQRTGEPVCWQFGSSGAILGGSGGRFGAMGRGDRGSEPIPAR